MEPQTETKTLTKTATLGKYQVLKTLGTGYNSKVKLVVDPETQQKYAAKIIKHSHYKLDLKIFRKEIEMLSKLKHPNVVNLIESHESIDYIKKDGSSYKVVTIILELVPGGELFEYVAEAERFSEEVARTFFHIMIETLEFCHGQGICHRDLKPENLLFDADFNLKIVDFGFAAFLAGRNDTGKLTTFLGTESYMAPEIHMRKPYSGAAVDLFAAGVILFIMVAGTPPFGKADYRTDAFYKLFDKAKIDIFWKAHERQKPKIEGRDTFFAPEFVDLINKMFAVDPTKRLSLQEIKESAWYNGPTVNMTDIVTEFKERKKLIDIELQKAREAKEQEKLKAKAKAGGGAFTGVRPFRSGETESADESGIEKLLSKLNLNVKRNIVDYQTDAGVKATTELYTGYTPDFLLQVIYLIIQNRSDISQYTISDSSYKIKCTWKGDKGECNFNIVLSRINEEATCVEFHKTGGNTMEFYQIVKEIKEKYNTLNENGFAQIVERNSPTKVQNKD